MTARLHLVSATTWGEQTALLPLHGGAAVRLLDAPVTYPLGSPQPVTSMSADDLPAHLRRFGERPRAIGASGRQLIDMLEHLALDGRGGGHFPVAAKWRTHLSAGGGGIVVANGAESEPASAKDTTLLQFRTHLVLDGLVCAAEAVGARLAVIWLHEDAHAAHAAVIRALDERRDWSLPEPTFRIALGPHRYVGGESSAIVRALSGGSALPDFRRVPAAVSGVSGLPTLVHNVETLARTALLARLGADLASTTLLTVATSHGRTVVEVPSGARLRDAVDWVLGHGAALAQQAVLVGGYGGSWVGQHGFARLRVDEVSLQAEDLSIGAGVLMPLHHDACGLAETAAIADYLADASARQCGPCVFGLRAVADTLATLVDLRARPRDAGRLMATLDEIRGRGACHHPDGAVRMVASALRTFATDARSHLQGGGCLHGEAETFFPVPAGG